MGSIRLAATGSSAASRAWRSAGLRPAVVELRLEGRRHLGEAARDLEVVDHGPQVQPGATDEHGVPATVRDVVQGPTRRGLEVGHREVLVGVDQVEQVVGHGGTGRRVRLRRPDVHPPVDAHGIDGDQFGVAPPHCQRERRGRLARGGHADQRDCGQALATGMRTR